MGTRRIALSTKQTASTAGEGVGEEGEHGDKRDCAHHQTDSQCSRERVGGRGGAWGRDGLLNFTLF